MFLNSASVFVHDENKEQCLYEMHFAVVDMEFDVSEIDFGYCTIYEAIKKTVKLTNLSILSQRFGFVGIPDVSHALHFLLTLNYNCKLVTFII